jgi:acetoin utilization deacetylase AcuC-like enzyme
MLLVATDPRFAEHDPGRGHPERPVRLEAVRRGLRDAGIDERARGELPARRATRAELRRVHRDAYLDQLEAFCARGGGPLDPDTSACAESWDAALLAAGSGLAAVDELTAGRGTAAFCAVRPPGHHAVPGRAMGFCLLNNVAVTAAVRDRGEKVLIVDWDAHHGNGTQDMFWSDPDVMYISLHEWPLYPGTGRLDDRGAGDGVGTTINFPLPAGATGDVFLAALDTVVAPAVERFGPDWVMVSAGFDGHRADPLTGLGLSAGDFADLAGRVRAFVPEGRTIAFLEGGYDLEALRDSVAATASALVAAPTRPEPATSGGPGRHVVRAAEDLHRA